ncbi:MAG: TorF family putative porin [Bacteroidota bacterium]
MKKNLLSIFVVFALFSSSLFAQSDSSKVNIGADLVSRYVWRGLDFGSSPSIQPYYEYAHKSGLTLGCWGAMSTLGNYNEVDLYAKYKIKGFSLIATDYFFPTSSNPSVKSQRFLNFGSTTTGHVVEGTLQWEGGEKFPLTILFASYFFGNDKNSDGLNNYSSYAEVNYTFNCKAGATNLFVGFTPYEGLYGNTMGVVNVGLSSKKEIKITDSFSLPVKASLITNPQTSNIYFVLGLTL